MKNSIESIKHKLRKIAEKENLDFDVVLYQYFRESLLYRLSISPYRSRFCLKGGSFLYALNQQKGRPTIDIDIEGIHISNNPKYLKSIFEEICQIEFPDDFVIFNLENLIVEPINESGKYQGIRFRRIEAKLGSSKKELQIDIGFGDAITPAPQEIDFPILLLNREIKIQGYPVETLIAEKFQAMIDLGEQNSRMKDFYDVFQELKKLNYNEETLEKAIKNTFARRSTSYQTNHPLFSESFDKDEDRLALWKNFLKKSNLDETIRFQEVLIIIKEKLEPIYEKLNPNISKK
jgi:hypothetical protein